MKVSKWAKYIFAGVVVILLGYFFLNKLKEGYDKVGPKDCDKINPKSISKGTTKCSGECKSTYSLIKDKAVLKTIYCN